MKRTRMWLWNGGPSPPSRIEAEPMTRIISREKEMIE